MPLCSDIYNLNTAFVISLPVVVATFSASSSFSFLAVSPHSSYIVARLKIIPGNAAPSSTNFSNISLAYTHISTRPPTRTFLLTSCNFP